MAAKPTNLAAWNSGGANNVEPSAGEKVTGWTVGQAPPSSYFNWWMRLIWQWIVYLDDLATTAFTWTAAHVFNSGITVVGGIVGTGTAAAGLAGAGVSGEGGVGAGAPGVYGLAGITNGVGVYGRTNADSSIAIVADCPHDGTALSASKTAGSSLESAAVYAQSTGYAVVARGDGTSPVRAGLRVYPQDANPSSAAAGDVFFHQGAEALRAYDGTAWRDLHRTAIGDSTGAPGAATLNTNRGLSAFSTGTSSLVITNSRVTTGSVIHATLRQTDATLLQVLRVVPASGFFTIIGDAASTGNVNVCWSVDE